MTNSAYIKSILVFMSMVLLACEGEDGIIGSGEKPKGESVQAIAEKGPYLKDSVVTISELNGLGISTGTISTSETVDNMGNFNFYAEDNFRYEVSIKGYHYNEVTNTISTIPLELKTIYEKKVNSTERVTVNVLTHLIRKRIRRLLSEGYSLDDSISKAEFEFSIFFGTELSSSEFITRSYGNLSLYNQNESDQLGNAYLLLATATLYTVAQVRAQKNNSVLGDELQNFMEQISDDFADDGIVNTMSIYDSLTFIQKKIDPESIMNNLAKYSANNSIIDYPVANLNLILDSDYDGIANAIDLDDDSDGIADVDDEFPYRFDIFTRDNTLTTATNKNAQIEFLFNRPQTPVLTAELRINVTSAPQFGRIVGRYPTLVFEPDPDFVGSDSMQYQVEYTFDVDKYFDIQEAVYISNTATISLDVR